MSCGEEAATAVRELQLILQALGTSQANMAGTSSQAVSLLLHLLPFCFSGLFALKFYSLHQLLWGGLHPFFQLFTFLIVLVGCFFCVCFFFRIFLGFFSEPLTKINTLTTRVQRPWAQAFEIKSCKSRCSIWLHESECCEGWWNNVFEWFHFSQKTVFIQNNSVSESCLGDSLLLIDAFPFGLFLLLENFHPCAAEAKLYKL